MRYKAMWCLAAIMLLVFVAMPVTAQVPPRPDPPRLVNDFAEVFGECQWLEDSLESIALKTSNQICVVTMKDLGGEDKAILSQKIGQEWGVGTEENRNGVIILIKPKTEDSKGEAFISTGYGLEGVLTDALCTQIVNQEMIPHFKDNDYLAGVWAGAQAVRDVAIGEYNQKHSGGTKSSSGKRGWGWYLTILIAILYLLYKFDPFGWFHSSSDDENNDNIGAESDTGTWGGHIDDDSGDSSDDDDDDNDNDDDDYSWSNSSNNNDDDSSWHGFAGGSFGGGGGGGTW